MTRTCAIVAALFLTVSVSLAAGLRLPTPAQTAPASSAPATKSADPAATMSAAGTSPNQPAASVAKRYAARQFNSKLALRVYVRVNPSINPADSLKLFGKTPSPTALEIPACDGWWVIPDGASVADTLKEVQAQSIPGLSLPFDTKSQDAALLKDMKELRILRTGTTLLKDNDLAVLESLTGLQELTMGLDVTDATFNRLKGLTDLQMLDLSTTTKFTDKSLDAIKGLATLQILKLNNTAVTDAGLEQLKGLVKLQMLDLSLTPVTDAGMEHLKGLANLRELNVKNTRVTSAGIAALQAAIPGLSIQH